MATHSSILAWRIPWTTVHEVAKSRTRLSNFHFQWLVMLSFSSSLMTLFFFFFSFFFFQKHHEACGSSFP